MKGVINYYGKDLFNYYGKDLSKLVKDDEYVKNGLIYCKNCNTTRTLLLEEDKVLFYLPNGCKCKQEEIKKHEDEKKLYAKRQKISKMIELSNIGKRYENARFSTGTKYISQIEPCKEYCISHDKGQGMYLFGKCGRGKTHLMCCMLHEFIEKNFKTCLLETFNGLLNKIKASYNGSSRLSEYELMKMYTKCDYLFIDDFGRDFKDSQFHSDKLFEIIDTRYRNMKPIIFSSNYSINQLNELGIQTAVIERVYEMCKGNLINFNSKENFRK